MSCRRAFEIDLAAFLSEPARPEHADFRAHYPTCAECAAEVRAWSELEASLHAFGAAHPEPAALLRFEDGASDLAAPERARIEAHLARCASCRDELRSLRAFPFESAAAGDHPKRSRPPARRTRIGRVRAVVLHPAFAYAVVALLAWPAAQSLLAPAARDAIAPAPTEVRARADVEPAYEPAKREQLPVPRLEEPQATSVPAEPAQAKAVAPAPRQAKSEAGVAPTAPPAPIATIEAEAPAADRAVPAPAPVQTRGAEYGLAAGPPAPAAAPPERAARVLGEVESRVAAMTSLRESDEATASGLLRIELPRELREEREILVRVRDAAHLRELRERVRPAPGSAAIEIALPEDWPAAAPFQVELRGASTAGDPERVFRQTLTR